MSEQMKKETCVAALDGAPYLQALMIARMAVSGVLHNPTATQAEKDKSLGVALNAIDEISRLVDGAPSRDDVLEEAAKACKRLIENKAVSVRDGITCMDAIRALKSSAGAAVQPVALTQLIQEVVTLLRDPEGDEHGPSWRPGSIYAVDLANRLERAIAAPASKPKEPADKTVRFLEMVRLWVERDGGDTDAALAWMYGPSDTSHIGEAGKAAEVDALRQQIAKLDRDLDEVMQERDRAQDALLEASEAMGGPEWCGKLPPMDPPESGDLHLDVPELCRQLVAERDELLAASKAMAADTGIVQELPPLPEPFATINCVSPDGNDYDQAVFSADQIRERDAMWMKRIAALSAAPPVVQDAAQGEQDKGHSVGLTSPGTKQQP